MRSYGQFCPVAIASEIVTERWTPLVVRELLCGSTRFNDLRRGVPLMSPSLLSKRLKTLERLGVVRRADVAGGVEYRLTDAGEELRPIIEQLGEWGQRWGRGEVSTEQLDASLLMWDVHRNIDPAATPDEKVVVHFHLTGSHDGKSRFWLVLHGDEVDLCWVDPGFEVDVEVVGDIRAMVRYWMGDAAMDELVRSGDLAIDGPRRLVRAFPTWFKRSLFASVPRP